MKQINLVGQKFNRLYVLKDSGHRSADGSTKWLCRCDCGNLCEVNTYNLRKGIVRSCGCYQKDKCRKTHKKYNEYDLSGEYGIGYTSNGGEFYFDLDDYDKIKDVCWNVGADGRVSGSINGKSIRLHKLITCTSNEVIDHINHNPSDNRKCNLRISDKQTNSINRPCNKNNKLGVKGVNRATNSNKFMARIMVDGKTIYLGCYNTIEEAAKARVEAEREYFGEFAYESK